MAQLTPAEIYRLSRKAGFDPLSAITATAIALAESGGVTDVIGDHNVPSAGAQSVGLFQINYVPGRDSKVLYRNPTGNLDPLTNAKNAFKISNGGKNFTPWTTFTSGKYKTSGFFNTASAAARTVDGTAAPATPATKTPRPAASHRPGRADAGQATQAGLDQAAKNPLLPNLWTGIEKFGLTAIFLVAGLGIVVLGVARATGVDKAVTNITPGPLP